MALFVRSRCFTVCVRVNLCVCVCACVCEYVHFLVCYLEKEPEDLQKISKEIFPMLYVFVYANPEDLNVQWRESVCTAVLDNLFSFPVFPSLVLPFFFTFLFLFQLILHSHHLSLWLSSSLCEKIPVVKCVVMCICD